MTFFAHERYQIAALMKAGQNQNQIATILGRHKSTISREIARNQGRRGYRSRQAGLLAEARRQGSRNARKIDPEVLQAAFNLVGKQWSQEQQAARLPVSHETLYRRYAAFFYKPRYHTSETPDWRYSALETLATLERRLWAVFSNVSQIRSNYDFTDILRSPCRKQCGLPS